MGHNIPPKATYPSVYVRHFGQTAGDWVNLTAAISARVISFEQRPGAAHDQLIVQLPTKRLEYFNTNDANWPISHWDEALVAMSGKYIARGTIRNWVRQWQGGEEVVEFTVLNMDQFHDDICTGQKWGKWDSGMNTCFSNTKATVPSGSLIFNEGGNPNFNLRETQYDHITYTTSGTRFWGSGNPNDNTAGWWNPIMQLQYLDAHIYSYGGGWRYRSIVAILGSVASTVLDGGWTDPTWQKPFPEMNVDGLTYGQGVEKILQAAGGFQYCIRHDSTSSTAAMRIFRTYPPYTAHQVVKNLYLPSAGSSAAPTAANTQQGRLNMDESARITHMIGVGAQKRYVGTFRLRPGWKPALTAAVIADPDLICLSKKDEGYDPQYADVMRRWILPRSTNDLNSLLGFKVGGSPRTPFSRAIHRFSPELKIKYTSGVTNDDAVAYLRPLLLYRKTAGDSLVKIDATWGLLPDEQGIFIGGSGGELVDNVFSSGDTGAVFTLFTTIAIPADERLVSSFADPRINASVAGESVPDIRRMMDYGESFHWEGPTPSHGDFQTVGSKRIVLEVPGTGLVATNPSVAWVNNQSGLDQRVKDEYYFQNTVHDTGQIVIPWIESTYAIGDVIGSIVGRHIPVNAIVVNRKWDFENQTTVLQLSDERYR